MRSAIGAITCVLVVYAGCSWLVGGESNDWHLDAADRNGGWVAVTPPTRTSAYQHARPRADAMAFHRFQSR